MGSLFNTLSIGYSGLNAAQVGVNTTSHNISNAESAGYTRQRVITAATTPVSSAAGNIGNGTEIMDIARIFDNFVYDRYSAISSDKEHSDFTKSTLETLSTYFPEIDDVGIKSDLKEYYKMWQSFADNPDNDAMKLALAKQADILSNSINATQDKIVNLQKSINEQIRVSIEEVNLLGRELANINKEIDRAEAGDSYTANDLRDRRNFIELELSKLIGAKSNSDVKSDMTIDRSSYESAEGYSLSVNGFNIVDGGSFHPIHMEKGDDIHAFYQLSYERQDGVLIPMEGDITGGKVGAILDLRGKNVTLDTNVFSDGVLQTIIDQMDAFAATLIESTNNIYASGATTNMESNTVDLKGDQALVGSPLNVKQGSFDIIMYDIDGNITAQRTINIDQATTLEGSIGSNSIEGQLKAQVDDNGDGNANNDIDNYIDFHMTPYPNGKNVIGFTMDTSLITQGYSFAIQDNLVDDKFSSGTNFAGAFGLNKFFDGDNASNIGLHYKLQENATNIAAGKSPVTGDNLLALDMMQQQFESYNFEVGYVTYESTVYGMFDVIATEVGVRTNEAILSNETVTAQFNATELEYSSISKVSIDEEMTNLIKYQTSYGAASKVITTVDQMMQTLLGLKQ